MALGTAVILYTRLLRLIHCSEPPVIEPGIAGAAGLTVMLTGELFAVNGEAQGAFEVITTVTTSPLFNVELEKLGLFVPTFIPFTFH